MSGHELPVQDHCDQDDPMVAASLGLMVLVDRLARSLIEEEAAEVPSAPAPPSQALGELDYAVLGLLGTRRTLALVLAGLVAETAEPPATPPSTMPQDGPVRPGELLP